MAFDVSFYILWWSERIDLIYSFVSVSFHYSHFRLFGASHFHVLLVKKQVNVNHSVNLYIPKSATMKEGSFFQCIHFRDAKEFSALFLSWQTLWDWTVKSTVPHKKARKAR